MKRIILLLMCVFTLSCVSAQTVGDGKKKNKNDNFRTIKTDSGKSVLPSYRSKKHLDLLKGRYNSPVMSDSYTLCENVSDSKRKRGGDSRSQYSMITIFDLNYACSTGPQHSFGATFGQIGRFGYYVSAMTGLDYSALNAGLECDQSGFVEGEMQYYSGGVTNSRYSVICGLMFRIAEPVALKFGAGYGARALAWETEGGLWIRNSYYSVSGIELNVGLQVFVNKFNLSFDFVSNSLKKAEFKIGLGININK
ncbi:MAG: hypothetical protein IKM23_02455 [Bacteroidales bacterium]|nr:hypothetical protein [Bacteroidales bacterium]